MTPNHGAAGNVAPASRFGCVFFMDSPSGFRQARPHRAPRLSLGRSAAYHAPSSSRRLAAVSQYLSSISIPTA